MKLITRDPNYGYYDRWLWLPKREVSEAQIASSLLYKRGEDVIHAWRETTHHFLVPRNYASTESMKAFRFPVIDSRFMDFPHVDIKSLVKPDHQRPDLTYQTESVRALHGTYDGILCLRCGGGKTLTALHAAVALKQPILVIVDEKYLAVQWRRAIEKFLILPNKTIGRVGDGKFDWKHDITIAIVQTLAARARAGDLPPAMARWFGVVIFDECHIMGAPYFNTVAPEFHGRHWGLSATPQREDLFDSLLTHTLGRVVYTYLMPEVRPHVYFLRLPTKAVSKKDTAGISDRTGNFHHIKAYGHLSTNVPRTRLILDEIRLALKKGRKPLILTHSKKMCAVLYDELRKTYPKTGVVTGDVSGKKREAIIKDSHPLIAIMKIGSKALDKPELDTLFVVDPFSKRSTIQQTFGRLLRLLEGKPAPVVIIVEDVLIPELKQLCGNMRRELSRWPEDQGGAIGYGFLQPGHHLEEKNGKV